MPRDPFGVITARLARATDLTSLLELFAASEVSIAIGHADPRGSAESNKELSGERAEAARQYLVEHGASGQNLRVSARREAGARGNDEASWALDCRTTQRLSSTRAPWRSNAATYSGPSLRP
ncbi:MAG: OmpA family protein [Pseudomonadota bacterium]